MIDAPVSKQWNIPSDWRLIAQLVFGSPEGEPKEKTQKPIEERVKIYGGNFSRSTDMDAYVPFIYPDPVSSADIGDSRRQSAAL